TIQCVTANTRPHTFAWIIQWSFQPTARHMTLHSVITAGTPGRKTCGRQWCTIEHCFKSCSVNTNRKERKHENGYAVEKRPPGRGTHDRRSRAGSTSCPRTKGPPTTSRSAEP